MAERNRNEVIVARWTVDAAALRNFVRETRLRTRRFSSVPKDLLKECEKHAAGTGLEVVVREDAVFVGDWRFPNWSAEVHVHDTWLLFMGDEGHHIPVPLAPGARAEAERVSKRYSALNARASAEAQRRFEEERAKPTWNNRLLTLAETHFAWVVLGFFFGLIPLLLLLLGFLRGSFSK